MPTYSSDLLEVEDFGADEEVTDGDADKGDEKGDDYLDEKVYQEVRHGGFGATKVGEGGTGVELRWGRRRLVFSGRL